MWGSDDIDDRVEPGEGRAIACGGSNRTDGGGSSEGAAELLHLTPKSSDRTLLRTSLVGSVAGAVITEELVEVPSKASSGFSLIGLGKCLGLPKSTSLVDTTG